MTPRVLVASNRGPVTFHDVDGQLEAQRGSGGLVTALAPAVREAYRAPYRGAGRRLGIEQFVRDIPASAEAPSAAEIDRIGDGIDALTVPAGALAPLEDLLTGGTAVSLIPSDRLAAVHRERGATSSRSCVLVQPTLLHAPASAGTRTHMCPPSRCSSRLPSGDSSAAVLAGPAMRSSTAVSITR